MDLLSAYDLVDHNLLLEKLEFYGVENDASEVLKSFINYQKVFTQIEGFNSRVEETRACSVI